MSGSGSHGSQTTLDGIHINHQWEFADKTAREATTNPKTNAPYVASEIYKYAIQLDNLSVWMLTGTTPTWVGVSVNSVVSGLTAGRVVYVDTDGSLTDDSALVWDASNNRMGIGTASPSYPLQLEGSGDQRFYIKSTGTTSRSIVDFRADTAYTLFQTWGSAATGTTAGIARANLTTLVSGNSSGIMLGNSSASPTIFITSSVERMRINSSGQVLINTTTATTGSTLDVAGDIVVSDGAGGAKITLGDDGVVKLPYQPAARGTASNQSIADSTWTILDITAKEYDNGTDLDLTNDRFTAPSDGVYFVGGGVLFASASLSVGAELVIRVYKNGVSTNCTLAKTVIDSTTTALRYIYGFDMIKLSAGDYIDLRIYQSSGGTLNTNNSPNHNHFTVSFMG